MLQNWEDLLSLDSWEDNLYICLQEIRWSWLPTSSSHLIGVYILQSIFLNTASLGNHDSPQIFVISSDLSIPRKDSGVVSCCLLHCSEFFFFFLFLIPFATQGYRGQSNLLYNSQLVGRRCILVYSKGICAKVNWLVVSICTWFVLVNLNGL